MAKETTERDSTPEGSPAGRPLVRLQPHKPTLTFGDPVKPREPAVALAVSEPSASPSDGEASSSPSDGDAAGAVDAESARPTWTEVTLPSPRPAEPPSALEADLPSAVKAEPPSALEADLPSAVKAELSSALEADLPSAVKAELPSVLKAELPSAMKLDKRPVPKELGPPEVRRTSQMAMRAARRSEPPRPPSNDRRVRAYTPARFDGLREALEPHLGWMSEELHADFLAALMHGDVLRAHDHLATELERYPKNLTIKKTLALYRSQVIARYEEALGGLHLVPRKTRSFPSMRVGDRQRLAAAIDGESPIEAVVRRSKLDRLRALETLITWLKAGSLEIVVPPGSPVAIHEATSPMVYERARITESVPPPAVKKVEVALHASDDRAAESRSQRLEGRALKASPPITRDEPPSDGDRDSSELPVLAARRPGPIRTKTRTGLRSLGGRAPDKATPLAMEAVTPLSREARDAAERPTLTDPVEAAQFAGRMGDAPTKPPPAPLDEMLQLGGGLSLPKPAKLPDLAPIEVDRSRSRPPRADRPESVPPGPASVAPRAASVAPRAGSVAPRPASIHPRASFAAPSALEPERRGEGRLLVGGVAILAVLGGLIYFATVGSKPPPAPLAAAPTITARESATARATTTVVVPPLAPSPTSSGATDAKPGLMRLTLDLEPPYAKVYLDGALLPKDKAHMIPRDGKEHELRVEGAGYKKRKLKFTADGDVRLVVSLELVASPGAAPAPTPTTTAAPAPIYDEPSPL